MLFRSGIWPLFFAMLTVWLIAVGFGWFYFKPRAEKERKEAAAAGKEGADAVTT